jgi:UDP-N-acetylmuramyl pentapeptide synthase
MFPLLLIGGVLLGSLSPLLTFARLFQMKEWRLDRLGEHLRREGWMRHTVGRVRAALAILFLGLGGAVYALMFMGGDGTGAEAAIVAILFLGSCLLGAYALLTVGQFLLRKQRLPVWTSKAIALVATALLLDAALAYGSTYTLWMFALPLVPALQPVVLLLSWLLWKPIDWILKNKLLTNASIHRNTFDSATVIGIVGSVGKTTTKELLKCVLADLSPIVTPEHVNTELGVAGWLLKNVPMGAEKPLLIVEMGAYRKGEIATLCRVAQPTIGVVTALGSDHLALFGSEEAIVDANAEILATLPADGHAFLLSDNAASVSLKTRAPCAVTLAGSTDATVIHTDRGLTLESNGSRFAVALHGAHNAGNAMLAVAVARHMGVPEERIRELLAGYRGSAHTFHLKKERGVLVMDDTYNVSPLSFRAALDWAKDRSERPRVLLTSGLLETGADEARFLRELGSAAKKSVERVVFTTDAGRKAFAEGFGEEVELLSTSTAPVSDDGLLLCVGRMPLTTLRRLLPHER